MNTDQFPIIISTPILVQHGERQLVENPICLEVPLEIQVNDESVTTVM